jgi:hypothetical protein
MIDRKLRHTLSAVACVATLFWCLALLSSANAAAQAVPDDQGTASVSLKAQQP